MILTLSPYFADLICFMDEICNCIISNLYICAVQLNVSSSSIPIFSSLSDETLSCGTLHMTLDVGGTINTHTHVCEYCKFGNFRKNLISVNSIKRHTCYVGDLDIIYLH